MNEVPALRSPLVRVLRALAVAALVAAAVAAVGCWVLAGSGAPLRSGSATLAGLGEPVTVRFDGWGVPHVQAAELTDLARAMGYLHANDRMTQLELGRRLAAGRLAEVVGDLALPSDRYFVQLGMRSYARDAVAALSAESRAILEAYAEGINGWLAERGNDLPPELRLLRVAPAPWTVIDSMYFQLQMAHDLSFFQGRPEEDRFIALRDLGRGRFLDLTGMAAGDIPDEIAELAVAAERSGGVNGGPWQRQLAATPLFPPLQSPGSNSWAMGAGFTAGGVAIVANDPHLPLRLPSIWYQASLHSPSYSAAGTTMPGFPFVILGQGQHVAWAFTNVMLDDHDVFFERTRADLGQVQRDGAWVDVDVHAEQIVRADGSAEVIDVRFTDLGVLLPAEPSRNLPPRSLAWTGAIAGDLPTLPLVLARARRAQDILGRLEEYVAPAQNLVAADSEGTLVFTAIGRVPRRQSNGGRLPAPAWDSARHWAGTYPQQTNRTLVSPRPELLITANAPVAAGAAAEGRDDLPQADFDTRHRADRIAQILGARSDWTLQEMVGVQMDVRSLYASEMLTLIGSGPWQGDASRAWELLADWDGTMAGTGAPALFALLNRALPRLIFDETASHGVGRIDARKRLLRVMAGRTRLDWFDDLTTAEVETRAAVLSAALDSAWRAAVERWGDDVSAWRYGSLHQLHLENPLGPLPLLGAYFSRGPTPWPGSATTVAAFGAFSGAGWERIAYGPSMRWISDPADPERALTVLPSGQSGHPYDPHYDDQLALYREGRLHGVAWSVAAAEAAALSTLRLLPERR